MVSAAMLVDLLGAWSDGADPLNEQLADGARARHRARAPAARDPAARPNASSRRELGPQPDDHRRRLRPAAAVGPRPQPPGQRDARRRPPARACPSRTLPRPSSTPTSRSAATPDRRPGRVRTRSPTRSGCSADARSSTTPSASPSAPCRPARSCAEAIDDRGPRGPAGALLGETGYDPFGLPALRAGHRRRTCAGSASRPIPTRSLITSGAQQALHLIASQLGGPGTSVAMENPTYIGAIDAFRTTGNRLLPDPGRRGRRRASRSSACSPAAAPLRLVYVVPTFHNPTGVDHARGAPPRAGRAWPASSASRSSRT